MVEKGEFELVVVECVLGVVVGCFLVVVRRVVDEYLVDFCMKFVEEGDFVGCVEVGDGDLVLVVEGVFEECVCDVVYVVWGDYYDVVVVLCECDWE